MTRFHGSMLVCSLALLLGGCDPTPDAEADESSERRKPRREGITAANIGAHMGALVEEHQNKVNVTWVVTEKGMVRAKVMRGETPVEDDVKGTVEVQPEGGQKKTHELDLDDGLLEADIGDLPEGVTEMRYALDLGKGETLKGVLELPKTGTVGIAENARKTADASLEGSGPHGGSLQKVGNDVVEVVGHKSTGEVRVYVLNDKLETVDPGKREIRIIASDETSETVKLTPVQGELYVKGKVKLDAHPVKLHVVVVHDHHTHVALCGHRPGHAMLVHDHHHGHPFVSVFIVDGWHHDHHDQHVHVKHKHHKKHHKGHGHHGGHTKVHVHVH